MNKTVSIFLDLLRICAAIAVVIAHFTDSAAGGSWPNLIQWGRNAVSVFFVLSGFVIAFVVDHKERDARSYAIARFARLYSVMVPAVLLSGIVLLLCVRWAPGTANAISQMRNLSPLEAFPVLRFLAQSALTLTFLNTLHGHEAFPAMNLPMWSLGYEAAYYMLFGVAVFARGWWRVVLLVLLSAVYGLEVLRLLPIWLAGVFLYHWMRHAKTPQRHILAICTVVLALSFVLYPYVFAWSLGHHSRAIELLIRGSYRGKFQIAGYLCGIMTCASIVLCYLAEPLFSKVLRPMEKPVRWFAGHTFGLYLFHQPMLTLLALVPMYNAHSNVHKTVALVAVVGSCFALSECTERQKKRWKRLVARSFDTFRIGGSDSTIA